MDSQQQQQQQRQQQANVAPAQPQQTYHPVTNDNIQPVQQQPSAGHALPPSYEQANPAKNETANQPPQLGNMAGAPPLDVISFNKLGDQPQWIDCPFCHQRTMTTVQQKGTSLQIVAGAILCLFCVCLACVPCLAGWFEDTLYRCSGCNNMIAKRRHGGPIEVYIPTTPVYPQQYSGNQAPMNAQQQQGHVPVQSYQQPHPQQQQQPLQQQPQQHQEQHPMHELQLQIQQHQQPVTQPDAKN